MCLAIPGKVLEIIDPQLQLARVDVAGIPRTVNLSMLEGDDAAGVGDWVLIYTGFATAKIDEAEALQTQQMLDGEEAAYELYTSLTAEIHQQMAGRQADPGERPGSAAG